MRKNIIIGTISIIVVALLAVFYVTFGNDSSDHLVNSSLPNVTKIPVEITNFDMSLQTKTITGTVYQIKNIKDDTITEVTTDENGKARIDLELGEYILTEKTPSANYEPNYDSLNFVLTSTDNEIGKVRSFSRYNNEIGQNLVANSSSNINFQTVSVESESASNFDEIIGVSTNSNDLTTSKNPQTNDISVGYPTLIILFCSIIFCLVCFNRHLKTN